MRDTQRFSEDEIQPMEKRLHLLNQLLEERKNTQQL